MIICNDKTIHDIRQTITAIYDEMYIYEIFMSKTRKTLNNLKERTVAQSHGMTINEMFAMDFRNTIEKIKGNTVASLSGIQMGLLQTSKRNTGFKGKVTLIKPIKEYNLKIKLIKKYDNNIKY